MSPVYNARLLIIGPFPDSSEDLLVPAQLLSVPGGPSEWAKTSPELLANMVGFALLVLLDLPLLPPVLECDLPPRSMASTQRAMSFR